MARARSGLPVLLSEYTRRRYGEVYRKLYPDIPLDTLGMAVAWFKHTVDYDPPPMSMASKLGFAGLGDSQPPPEPAFAVGEPWRNREQLAKRKDV